MTNNFVEEVCVLHFVYLLYIIYLNNLILLLNRMIRNRYDLINTNSNIK